MSKFAPASINIWTIASSPAAQAYISGVIPYMNQRQMLNCLETEHEDTCSIGVCPRNQIQVFLLDQLLILNNSVSCAEKDNLPLLGPLDV